MDWDVLEEEIEDFDFEFDVEKIKTEELPMFQKKKKKVTEESLANPQVAELEANLDDIISDLQSDLGLIPDYSEHTEKKVEKRDINFSENELNEIAGVIGIAPNVTSAQEEAQAIFNQIMAEEQGLENVDDSNAPLCSYCHSKIIGECVQALNRKYHPEHFVCHHCKKPFMDRNYFVNNEKPFCEDCFQELYGFRCSSCLRPITNSCISALGRKFHPEHFACSNCGVKLRGEVYYEYEGLPLCEDCEDTRLEQMGGEDEDVKVCSRCGGLIYGEFVQFSDQYLCPEHLVCNKCGIFLKGGKCFIFENEFYCEEDYKEIIRGCCAYCHQPIEGRVVQACEKNWHKECFKCSHCEHILNEQKYFEHEMKPFCEVCYHMLHGEVCSRCKEVIRGKVIKAIGKTWHPHHFTCAGCNREVGSVYHELDDRPLCKKCYKKLPSTIRRKADNQKAVRKKREEADEKEKRFAEEDVVAEEDVIAKMFNL